MQAGTPAWLACCASSWAPANDPNAASCTYQPAERQVVPGKASTVFSIFAAERPLLTEEMPVAGDGEAAKLCVVAALTVGGVLVAGAMAAAAGRGR